MITVSPTTTRCAAAPLMLMGPRAAKALRRLRDEALICDVPAVNRMVAERYECGKALNAALLFEIDDVIDPADTRDWILEGLRSVRPRRRVPARSGDGW
ncbi:hypothetical protein [Bradyrhizobium sp. UFLA06-06]